MIRIPFKDIVLGLLIGLGLTVPIFMISYVVLGIPHHG